MTKGKFVQKLEVYEQVAGSEIRFDCRYQCSDIIVIKAEEWVTNTKLPDFEALIIKTYSFESTIAERFDAILQRFELTGRMIDFYGIYYW